LIISKISVYYEEIIQIPTAANENKKHGNEIIMLIRKVYEVNKFFFDEWHEALI